MNVTLTLFTTFTLAQRSFKARNVFTAFFAITMFDPDNAEFAAQMQHAAELIKYGIIIVASAPLLIIYPFFAEVFCERHSHRID